jgi:hypothetical protein
MVHVQFEFISFVVRVAQPRWCPVVGFHWAILLSVVFQFEATDNHFGSFEPCLRMIEYSFSVGNEIIVISVVTCGTDLVDNYYVNCLWKTGNFKAIKNHKAKYMYM